MKKCGGTNYAAAREISEALERDIFMRADEAKDFGLIDSVVEKRK